MVWVKHDVYTAKCCIAYWDRSPRTAHTFHAAHSHLLWLLFRQTPPRTQQSPWLTVLPYCMASTVWRVLLICECYVIKTHSVLTLSLNSRHTELFPLFRYKCLQYSELWKVTHIYVHVRPLNCIVICIGFNSAGWDAKTDTDCRIMVQGEGPLLQEYVRIYIGCTFCTIPKIFIHCVSPTLTSIIDHITAL